MGAGRGNVGKDNKEGANQEKREVPKPREVGKLYEDWHRVVAEYRQRDASGEVLDGDELLDKYNRLYRLYEHVVYFQQEVTAAFFMSRVQKGISDELQYARENIAEIDQHFPNLSDVKECMVSSNTGFQHQKSFAERIFYNYQVNRSVLHDELIRMQEGRDDDGGEAARRSVRGLRETILVDMQLYEALEKDIAAGKFASKAELSSFLAGLIEPMAQDWQTLNDLYRKSPSVGREEAYEYFFGNGGRRAKGGERADGRPERRSAAVDLYAILGVARNTSKAEIKKAFRALAMKSHPDIGGDAEEFKKYAAAYEILSDDTSRANYDRTGDPKGRGW